MSKVHGETMDGQYLSAEDVEGNTALHRAIAGGRFDEASSLIDQNILVGVQNKKGQTALHVLTAKSDFPRGLVPKLIKQISVDKIDVVSMYDHGRKKRCDRAEFLNKQD